MSVSNIDWLAIKLDVIIKSSFIWVEVTIAPPVALMKELSDSSDEKEAEVSAGSNRRPVIWRRSESRRLETLAAIDEAADPRPPRTEAVGKAPAEKLIPGVCWAAEMYDKLLLLLLENESIMASECDRINGVLGVLKKVLELLKMLLLLLLLGFSSFKGTW